MINMVMGGSFRHYIWDPVLILSQIAAIQGFYYTSLGIIISILFQLSSAAPTLNHLLSPAFQNLSNLDNTLVVMSNALNSLCVSVFLWVVVQRAKLCLDFTCTLHFLHALIGWLYSGVFVTFSSFIIQIICISISAIVGEYLCMRSALRDIPLLQRPNRIDL